jgi:hypothetical protein
MTDPRCTHDLVCNSAENAHTNVQGSGEQSDIPRAMALRLITRSPRGIGLSCPRRLTETDTPARSGFRTSARLDDDH